MSRVFRSSVSLILSLGIAGQVKAAEYILTTLNVPGASFTAPHGINNASQIVGMYGGVDSINGFLLSGGVYTTLDVPGASFTMANGINDAGQIVGTYGDNFTQHSFLLTGGVYTTLDVPGASGTQAWGINDAGQIVGQYFDAKGDSHDFLLNAGRFTTLDVSGASSTTAIGINDAGVIVGTYSDNFGKHSFLLDAGIYMFDVPASFSGINDAGQIVGQYIDAKGDSRGFVQSGGVYTTFDVPGASLSGINDAGVIVGSNLLSSTGFLATPSPVPEPATLTLFGLGTLGVLGYVRCRQRGAAP